MAGGEDVDVSTSNSQSSQTQSISEHNNSPLDILQGHLGEVTSCTPESIGDDKKELELLWRRVKTTASLLTYLRSKARIITIPHLALTSYGITYTDGAGFVDRNGIPMSNWSTDLDLSDSDFPDVETWIGISNQHDEQDGVYIGEVMNSVQMITDVMESLLKRVLMAETETDNERQKVKLSEEEIMKKGIHIESLSEKLAEMDRYAADTNIILKEMSQWVDELLEETSSQRLRAMENEEELMRVKREFETLKTYVSGLTTVGEALVSSEKHFQDIEKKIEMLIVTSTLLETEKKQKEAEVQKLMDENIRLSALLDKKEAQLVAMSEQCKVFALSASNI